MIISRHIGLVRFLQWSWFHLLWLAGGSSIIALLYKHEYITVSIPWLPVSVIGTAVAFFVGFKNNQAYDRMWEARKIWGGIVNNSRSWGMQVNGYLSNYFNDGLSNEEVQKLKQQLIYRHIAWLYTHRSQLLVPTPWEPISQKNHFVYAAKKYRGKFGIGLFAEEEASIKMEDLLDVDELNVMSKSQNPATQLINKQAETLKQLRGENVVEDFRHVELISTLKQFYELQGKNERIKKFPLPRQYANLSRYFVAIFMLLFPFSIIPELMRIEEVGFWLSIPICSLIGWVYLMMETVGDYTENPFQGMANDIPMLSLCRTIEIDLREMLGETDLPKPIAPKGNVLM